MKILIAEDDASLRRAIVSILQKNNYTVESVDNGRDAFNYLCSNLYDAAILDIMMPVMDGVSVLIRLRKEHNTTPILLLTAKSEIDDKINGLDAGANDYLANFTDRFYRKDTSDKVKGFGIGLSIAQVVAEAHKGRITVELPKDNMIKITAVLK